MTAQTLEVLAGPDDSARHDVHPPIDGAARILVHVRNRGRRPVALERIWYTRKSTGKTKHLLTDRYDRGPEVIGEGESVIHELYSWDVVPDDLGKIVVEAQDGHLEGKVQLTVEAGALEQALKSPVTLPRPNPRMQPTGRGEPKLPAGAGLL